MIRALFAFAMVLAGSLSLTGCSSKQFVAANPPAPAPDPRDARVQAILDQKIRAAVLPDIPVPEAIEMLKSQVGRDVSLVIDPDAEVGNAIVTVDLHDVRLRRLLRSMLQPSGLGFIVRDGAVFISTADRLPKELPPTTLERKSNPNQVELQAVLDKELRPISFPGCSLEYILGVLERQANWLNYDIDPAVRARSPSIKVSLEESTLRSALHAMLQPNGLDFIARDGIIYISTPEGCRKEEMRPENLVVRRYEVGDILAALSQEIGLKKDEKAVADNFLHTVDLLAGAGEWDEVKVLPGAPDAEADPLPTAPPRMLVQRGKNLLVRHCERMQDQIEKSLADLRAKVKAGKPIRTAEPVPHAPGVADPNPH